MLITLEDEQGEYILTSRGYLPIKTLEHYIGWEINDQYVKFREVFKLEGKVVKESAHAQPRNGLVFGADQATM